MPLIGRINELARETLAEAKLIKGEEGPSKIKKYVDRLLKKASKPDKTELCRMSNHEIFFTFLILTNDNTLSFDESLQFCDEIKKSINGWTFAKDGNRLLELEQATNSDGSLIDLKYTVPFQELGLTPYFLGYNMKLVYMCMYDFLKLKRDILTPQEYTKNLPLPQRMTAQKNVYKKSRFYNFVDVASKCLERDVKDHDHRQRVSGKRIKATEEVLEMLENGTLETIHEFPSEWHEFLDPHLLELLYELVLNNLFLQKKDVESTEKELLDKINKSELTTYLYNHNLDPYSLEDKLPILENIPNITSRIDFFKKLNIPIQNILTIYYDYLISITEEQLKTLNFLIDNHILSTRTLRNNLNIIGNDYQRIIANYEILKNLIDFKNIFYNDSILLEDLNNIKNILSILKEYKLNKNNFIFLLCNIKYINIYDLLIENDIPEYLFISICQTDNPLNTIKRILIYKNIGEEYETSSHILKKDVTSEQKYICSDDFLDSYLPNIVTDLGMNLLNGNSISTIIDSDIVKYLDEQYLVENTYIIGNTSISRPKFLRNFESVQGNPNYLILSLVSNSILSEQSYYDIVAELKGKQLKK